MRRRRRKKMMMPIVRLSSTIISLIIWYYGIVSFVTLDHLIGSIHAVSSETKHHQNCATIFDEKVAKIFIEQVNEKLEKLNYEIVETSWRFNTDITEENQEALVNIYVKGFFFFCLKSNFVSILDRVFWISKFEFVIFFSFFHFPPSLLATSKFEA